MLLKLVIVLREGILQKSRSKQTFFRELSSMGLPSEAVEKLTAAYADMVSLNAFYYIKPGQRRVRHVVKRLPT